MSAVNTIQSAEHLMNDRLLGLKNTLRTLTEDLCGAIPPPNKPLSPSNPSKPAHPSFVDTMRSVQEANNEAIVDIVHLVDYLCSQFGSDGPASANNSYTADGTR